MLGVGEKFPTFALSACVVAAGNSVFHTVTDHDFSGRWKVYFFWGKDFTEHGRTELIEFARLAPGFAERDTHLISVSIESETAHAAWRQADLALRNLPFLMLADTRRNLSGQLGILDESHGVAQPAAFIVDPHDTIRFVYVTDPSLTPDPVEVLRVLTDLQDIFPAGNQ